MYSKYKKFKKVDRIEVKRCYIVSQYIRNHDRENKRYLPELSHEEFEERLRLAKQYVLQLTEIELDELITKGYRKRTKAYNSCDRYIATVIPEEVGVWKGAGGLPIEWTNSSLADTAKRVSQALHDKNNNDIAKRAIPRIWKHLDSIEKEPYLFPIILPGGTMGRRDLQKMNGDIGDGNMRAIALICSGRKEFQAYVGILK